MKIASKGKVAKAYNGLCKADQVKIMMNTTVCGTDGISYPDEYYLMFYNVSKAHDGECHSDDQSN